MVAVGLLFELPGLKSTIRRKFCRKATVVLLWHFLVPSASLLVLELLFPFALHLESFKKIPRPPSLCEGGGKFFMCGAGEEKEKKEGEKNDLYRGNEKRSGSFC